MKKSITVITFFVLFTMTLTAQTFNLSAEVRPRYENKQGYKTLQPTDANGANFISQRTRLNFKFKNDKIKTFIALQNVRVWGDVSTLSSTDNQTALHEAWAEVTLSKQVSLKLGRQEIAYDNQRIFGSVGWAQQARSHDAFLLKYTPNVNNRVDVSFAMNADSQVGVDQLYSNAAGYKSFLYAWYHGNFNKLGVSILALNTGIEYLDDTNQTIDYMQTVGPIVTYQEGKFNADATVYVQIGKTLDTDVNALYYSGNLGYKINTNFSLGLGYEYLSGKDQDDENAEIKSFAPLFGTNHKFNGWMDYFYVGNHANSVGLNDINATISYKKDNFLAKVVPHLFSTAADVYNGTDKMEANLGTEIDVTISYKIAKDISLSAGYSKMLATDTMEALKGGDKDENNSWGWIMFRFTSKLFSHTSSN